MHKRLPCLILSLLMILSVTLSVSAQEQDTVIYISTKEGFLELVENCRLDSYSQNLTVQLRCDIDLSDSGFTGIPIFSGIFEGNGHSISGLQLDGDGSNTGLFRYLTETAVVRDLHITGIITPGGSGSTVGGIAGSNAGTIEKCSFEGKVSGIDNVGGLVGINQLTGVIDRCSASGTVNGNHFVGGIAGSNHGVIRDSDNHASINTTIEQNHVGLEDITLESIMSSESATTVTDIGGICGTGTGVIRNCENRGSIGYPKIGYNIGGIAGSWSGYLYQCKNHGRVDGRKEVGGIVGQLEPAVSILYQEDTLQTLQQQMDTMSGLTSGAGYHIQSGSNALGAESQNIEKQVEDAQKALDILMPDEDDPNPPDAESIQAAQNALSSSFSEISASLNNMMSISESTLGVLNKDIQGISNQMNAISGTIGTASENLGGSIRDVSDDDTAEDLSAKIQDCLNLGSVDGDWNVGGIAGAIALENDMDPESDLQLIGNSSLNYDMSLRAVILDSENQGAVQGKKQNVGGIAGWISLGLVKQCVNTAAVDAATADYTGGIAGQSSGYIRHCSAKCALSGETYTGGIAGSATTVTDCYAMTDLHSHGERAGAVLGAAEDSDLSANYYLPIGKDPGGVDGISYAAKAEPLASDKFFELDGLPNDFHNIAVTFRYNDSKSHRLLFPYGTILTSEMLPPIPGDNSQEAVWTGEIQMGEQLFFDTTFTLTYADYLQTLESSLQGHNGLATLLVQGKFSQDALLSVTALDAPDTLAAYSITVPHSELPVKLRCLLPEGVSPEHISLSVQTDTGWHDTEFTVSGSYLVFDAPDGIQGLQLKEIPFDYEPYILSGAAILAVLVLILSIALIKRKKRAKK